MIRRVLVVLLGVVVAVVGISGVASAHTALSQSVPGDGTQVDEVPALITLTFGEEVAGPTAQVGVLVGDREPVQLDAPLAGATLTLDTTTGPLAELVAEGSGKWAIAYTVTGQDGHPIDGTVTFTVTGAAQNDAGATAGASVGAAGSAATSDAAGADLAGRASTDTQAAADEPMSPLLWLATVAVIGLVVFAVVKTDRLRRRKAEAAAKAAAAEDGAA